ncbi:hypothetical protein N2152v2_010390 [Parachlorella kessleri]
MAKPVLQLSSAYGAQLGASGSLAAAGQEKLLLAAGSGVLSLINVASGETQAISLPANGKPVGCTAYSVAAGAVAVGEVGFKPVVMVRFDNQPPQEPGIALRGHNFGIAALAWSSSGTLLASTGVEKDRQLLLWNPVSGAQLGRVRLQEDYHCLEFLDDKTLCAINNDTLSVWVLDKTVSVGNNTKYKLTLSKSYVLDLPTSSGGSSSCKKGEPHMLCLTAMTTPIGGTAGRRLWAALDTGLVLLLRTNGKPEKVLDLSKAGRLNDVAASASHLACAFAGGNLKVYSAASLEEVASLSCPGVTEQPALRPTLVSCAFSGDGTRLSALFSSGQLCSWDCSNMAEPALDYTCDFHASPVTDALLIQNSSQCFVASCSQDGKVQLQQLLASDGQLVAPPATVDLRQQAQLRGVRLTSLAACPVGSLLAAGDTLGSVHLFAIFGTSPSYFRSLAVHNSELTALSFAPPITSSPQSCQLLAVGAKSGALSVLDSMHGYAVVAQLVQHGSPVVATKWVQSGSAQSGSPQRLQLLAATRDGSITAYALPLSSEGGIALVALTSYHPATPKGPLVSLHTAVLGQAAAVGSRDGGMAIFDALSGETLVDVPTDKNGGEITAMTLDEGICIAVTVNNRNMLQILDRETGHVLARSKAHLSGTVVARVLLTPDSAHVVTVGEDACIRVWGVPPAVKLKCLAEQERLRQVLQPMSEAKTSATSELSELHPQNLFDQHFEALSPVPSGPVGLPAATGREGGVVAAGGPVGVIEAEEACTPASGGSSTIACSSEAEEISAGVDYVPAHEQQLQGIMSEVGDDAAPSPSRHQGIAQGLQHQLGQLEAQLLALKASPRRRPSAEERMAAYGKKEAQQTPPLPAQPPSPVTAPPSLSAYLRSSSLRSLAAGISSHTGTAGGEGASSAAVRLARRRSSIKREPWQSPREGAGLWVPLDSEEDAIAAAEAQRCSALVHCSEGSEVEQPQQKEEQVQVTGGHPVAAADGQPSFASGGRSGASEQPAAMASSPDPSGTRATAAADAQPLPAARPNSAPGIERSPSSNEDFTIWSDPSTPGARPGSQPTEMSSVSVAFGAQQAAVEGMQGNAAGPCSTGSQGSAASRRLSFSFNMGGQVAKEDNQEEGGTPSFLGKAKQPAAPTCPQATPQHSGPSLGLSPANTDASTPSMIFKPKHAKRPAEQAADASVTKPTSSAPRMVLSGSTAKPTKPAEGGVVWSPSAASPGLRGRPAVPRLNLPGSHPASPASPAEPGLGFEYEEDTPLRLQYSSRSSTFSVEAETSPSPTLLERGGSKGRDSSEGSMAGYGTTSSSEQFSDSAVAGEADEGDVFDSAGIVGTSSAGAVSPLHSPPTLHDNQLFDSSAPSSQAASPAAVSLKPAGPPGKPSLLHTAHAKPPAEAAQQAAAKQGPTASDSMCEDPSEAGDGSARSHMSAYDRPPAYDPLELSPSKPAGVATLSKPAAVATGNMSSHQTPAGVKYVNELYGSTPGVSQVNQPFTTHNAGSFQVAMAKNPAYDMTPGPMSCFSFRAPALRRMSTFLHAAGTSAGAAGAQVSPTAAWAGAGATGADGGIVGTSGEAGSPVSVSGWAAGLGLAGAASAAGFVFSPEAPHTGGSGVASSIGSQALGAVTPSMVISMFEVAMHGFQVLESQGRVGEELLGRLGELGISLGAARGCSTAGVAAPAGIQGCSSTPGEASCCGGGGFRPEPERGLAEDVAATAGSEAARLSLDARSALKDEILRELRRDIAAGALNL